MGERLVGTISRGIHTPIIREGDNLAQIVMDSVLTATADNDEGFTVRDMDMPAAMETVVTRVQGNYATANDIAAGVKIKYGDSTIGVIFPTLSRNHSPICSKGVAKGAEKIVLILSHPSDEAGNHLVDEGELDEEEVNPRSGVLSEERYRELFEYRKRGFTGVDYIGVYKELIAKQDAKVEVVLANDCHTILDYTNGVLCCSVHSRIRTKCRLLAVGAKAMYSLDDILIAPINDSGYNENCDLLGSNKATEDTVKLFPRDYESFVNQAQQMIKERTSRQIEVIVCGDSAFKNPIDKIWELTDPRVSPVLTPGLSGQPNEIKLGYLTNNDFADLSSEKLRAAISERIRNRANNLVGDMASQEAVPRRLIDLIDLLCDPISGSGSKGTPVVYIQGYSDSYTK